MLDIYNIANPTASSEEPFFYITKWLSFMGDTNHNHICIGTKIWFWRRFSTYDNKQSSEKVKLLLLSVSFQHRTERFAEVVLERVSKYLTCPLHISSALDGQMRKRLTWCCAESCHLLVKTSKYSCGITVLNTSATRTSVFTMTKTISRKYRRDFRTTFFSEPASKAQNCDCVIKQRGSRCYG